MRWQSKHGMQDAVMVLNGEADAPTASRNCDVGIQTEISMPGETVDAESQTDVEG